eukprot:scaffold70995_cov60-Phaeocystis_antarctica.AAC.2
MVVVLLIPVTRPRLQPSHGTTIVKAQRPRPQPHHARRLGAARKTRSRLAPAPSTRRPGAAAPETSTGRTRTSCQQGTRARTRRWWRQQAGGEEQAFEQRRFRPAALQLVLQRRAA